MYFFEFQILIEPFNRPSYGHPRAQNIQPLALKPFMHKNFFRNRMDLNDAVDANLILAAKKDHHEYQQSAEN